MPDDRKRIWKELELNPGPLAFLPVHSPHLAMASQAKNQLNSVQVYTYEDVCRYT